MKKILITILAVLFSAIIVLPLSVFVVYRVPAGKSIIKKREVVYKMIQFFDYNGPHDTGLRAWVVEPLFKNKKMYFMGDDGATLEQYYLSEKDYDLCWPEAVFKMSDKGYTVEATLEVNKLLFGGYGVARVIKAEKKKGKPIMRK